MRSTTIVTALAIAGFAIGSAIAQQAPQGAQGQKQGQNSSFCLQGSDGLKNCGYSTMALCEAAKKGQSNATCVQNVQTTGSGITAPAAKPATGGATQPPK